MKIKSVNEFNELLIKNGYSKRGFAKKAGLAEASFIQISNGQRSPRPETAKKICNTLNCSFDDVFIIENKQ